jgi:hypothetical protein
MVIFNIMDQRRIVVVATAVGFLILAIILGTIFYLSQNINKSASNKVVTSSPLPATSIPTATSSPSPKASGKASASPSAAPEVSAPAIAGTKVYSGQNFSIAYPQNWGLLTCSNSSSIELDPLNSTDSLKVSCSYATKPITIISKNITSCPGDPMTLGANQVFKSRRYLTDGVDYRWCIKGTPGLDITHRVSLGGQRATSKEDFSVAVEEMISRITIGTVASGS